VATNLGEVENELRKVIREGYGEGKEGDYFSILFIQNRSLFG